MSVTPSALPSAQAIRRPTLAANLARRTSQAAVWAACTLSIGVARVSAIAEPPEARHTERSPGEYQQRAQQRLEAFREANGCPGATLAFVLPDSRAGSVATGVSHKASGQLMKPNDRMFSGSIGKTYVSVVLLQLAKEGRVELDTKIQHWFGAEAWFDALPNAGDITLRMLMNHTSGIRRHIFTEDFQAAVRAGPHKVWRPEELIAYVLNTEPLFPAGKGWSYADTNYILVGMIIERVTKRTYYGELTDRLLNPLALSGTIPADRPDLPGLISGYTSKENIFNLPEEVAVNGRYAINPQLEWTGGGLISTSRDLARWANLLYEGHALPASLMQEMLEGVATAEGSDRKYGLGVMIRPSQHGTVLGHAGWVPGYLSMMAYYPDHKLSVAVQVNGDVGLGLAPLERLLDEVASDLLQP